MYIRIEPKGAKGIIFLIAFTLFFIGGFIFMFNQISGDLFKDGKAVYNKNKMNEYLKTNYENEFKSSAAYEDNIIFIFLYNEEYNDYSYDFYTGYDISTSVYNYLGNYSITSIIERYFEVSNYEGDIEKNLSKIMNEITIKLDEEFDGYLKCDHTNDEYISKFTNNSNSELDSTKIEESLKDFTDTTRLSIVMVVDTMENVFGRTKNVNYDFLIIFGIIVLLFLIMMVYAFTVVIKNTLKDKKEKHSKFGEVEKKNPGIKPIPGMDYHNNDNDDFNINPKDYK
ncbi:MAG: hypothetical protein IJA65_05695 [Acholeplasmatales bacterium]|nr:hypothetical protein [Acholeplasmatales bacterium]